jgi:peptide/nickel transport system ATP-binding protein
MYLGRVMEVGPVSRVFTVPRHPYTQALLSAMPHLDPAQRRTRVLLQGDPPRASDPPAGCVFRTRCPMAIPECAQAVPPLKYGVACIRA